MAAPVKVSNISFPISERFRRLSKESAWIVLGQAAAVVGSLAGVRLLTELLDPVGYGELVLGMTVTAVVNQMILGPLGGGVTRFYSAARERGDVGGYLTAVRRLLLSATAVIVLLNLLIAGGLRLGGAPQWAKIVTAALVFAVISGYNAILGGIQTAARQRSVVALHQGIESWVRYLVAAGFLLILGPTSTAVMIGYAVAVALVFASQYAFFWRQIGRFAIDDNGAKDWHRKIWSYSWPISVFGVFTWAQQSSDRWALNLLGSTRDVGLYGVITQLGYYPISLAVGMALQLMAPILYERAGDASDVERNAGVNKLAVRLALVALGLTLIAFTGAWIFHAQIFRVFVASEYAEISPLLPWMLLSGGIFAGGQAMTLSLMSQLKTRALLVCKITTALLGMGFNFVGALWWGLQGIVGASLLFSTLFTAWMAVITLRKPSGPS